MNAVQVRGRVRQVRGEIRKRWSGLTGDRLGRLNGRLLKLLGTAQVRYGRLREAVGL
jgi:uncharacterized protein YjbJ (UPF0337 family)